MSSGRKRVFSLKELESIFHKYESDIVRNDGRILKPSDSFWSDIKRRYKIPNTEKSIYTDAWKWNNRRQNPQSTNIVSPDSNFMVEKEVTLNSTNSSTDSVLNMSDKTDESLTNVNADIKFHITLTTKQWKTIEPISRTYQRMADKSHKKGVRIYQTLKPGAWSSLITERIAQHPKKIICNWSFSRAQVSAQGKQYIYIVANCVTCSSNLIGILQNKPNDDEPVTFMFMVRNFDESRHQGTRKNVKVTGSQARTLATSHKTAITLHREISAKSGKLFEQARGRVPSANAIRKLKSRERTKERLSSDVFQSLQLLKAAPNYKKTIHMVGLLPFFVVYGSNHQIRLHNMYEKHSKISRMCCDATGGVIRKLGTFWKKNYMNIIMDLI